MLDLAPGASAGAVIGAFQREARDMPQLVKNDATAGYISASVLSGYLNYRAKINYRNAHRPAARPDEGGEDSAVGHSWECGERLSHGPSKVPRARFFSSRKELGRFARARPSVRSTLLSCPFSSFSPPISLLPLAPQGTGICKRAATFVDLARREQEWSRLGGATSHL